MLKIEITVPRPWLTLGIILGLIAAIAWSGWEGSRESRLREQLFPGSVLHDGMGGPDTAPAEDAEGQVRRLREEQEVLKRQEGILRGELAILETQGDEYADIRRELVRLLEEKQEAERELLESLFALREARGRAIAATASSPHATIALSWPVNPLEGISAFFDDPAYENRFGFPHRAIDIPVLQGSVVHAAADGVVLSVSDHGMGFNSVTIRHEGGVATLYGHVSKFLVREGQTVRSGQPIAYSGGMPGTKGAGHLSTGPHLHFEVISAGAPVDPLPLLPAQHFEDY